MKLTFDEIRNITRGAVRVTEDGEGVKFYRFTEEEEDLYRVSSADFYRKTFSTAGIRLEFETDADALSLKLTVTKNVSTRSFYAFDLYENGSYVDSIKNFTDEDVGPQYNEKPYPIGSHEKSFPLRVGTKRLTLYFPWSAPFVLHELSLANATYIKPVKKAKTLLCYGDSITQGYDALYPSHSYAVQLADRLGATLHNKAIGGEVFCPQLAAADSGVTPDYITVAYGTNDWAWRTKSSFRELCHGFYQNLKEKYPTAQIFGLSPIWRADFDRTDRFCPFSWLGDTIQSVCEEVGVTFIHGFDLVPGEVAYYSDLRVHPNDEGFRYYSENLIKEIEKHL